MEELISFQLYGKMAHFRKFYSNASALSHTLPPRTTILGILASLAYLPRDSYYLDSENSEFDQLLIGVQLESSVRKIFQKLNYLKVDSNNLEEFRGFGNRKQVSMEFVIPSNIREDYIIYRIYVGTIDSKYDKYSLLKESLKKQFYPFGISLGSSNLIGFVNSKEEIEINFDKPSITDGSISIHSAILANQVREPINKPGILIEQDTFPLRFRKVTDKQISTRIASEVSSLIYSTDGENGVEMILNNFNNIFYLPEFKKHIALI